MPWQLDSTIPGGTDRGIGDELRVPAVVTMTYHPERREPGVRAVFTASGDGPVRCTEVRFTMTEQGREVRNADLDALDLDALAEEALGASAARVVPEGGAYRITLPSSRELPSARRAVRRDRGTRQRQPMTEELLRDVAEVYRSAGKRPTATVADHLGIPHRTAGDYVKRARQRGYLGAALGAGRAGEQTGE